MGSSNETSYYGPVKNPWDLACVPVAHPAVQLQQLLQIWHRLQRVQIPAALFVNQLHLCGITGLKPTYGRVSRYGMIAFASSLIKAVRLQKPQKMSQCY